MFDSIPEGVAYLHSQSNVFVCLGPQGVGRHVAVSGELLW